MLIKELDDKLVFAPPPKNNNNPYFWIRIGKCVGHFARLGRSNQTTTDSRFTNAEINAIYDVVVT